MDPDAAPAQVPRWSWAYVSFRVADGLSNQLIALAVILAYGQPLWMLALTTALMNVAGVPATFLWGAVVDRTPWRRSVVVAGFLVAAGCLAVMATLPPFPVFVAAAVVYTGYGVATAPAASTLVLQSQPRAQWAQATSRLSRRTGLAYLAGLTIATALTFAQGHAAFAAQLAAAAVMSLGGAAIAWRTVPAWRQPLPHEADYDPRLALAGQRLFERSVFFPGRMRHPPRLRDLRATLLKGHRLWPLGFVLTFTGSVCFFASYTGILHDRLHVSDGLVLLCQMPSNLVSPLAYPVAGRWGGRVGEAATVLRGSLLRTLVIPALAVILSLAGAAPSPVVVAILALHGLMGLSFALLQVNGVVLIARDHPGGRGRGVGTYHAAVGLGTLFGSGLAFLLLRHFDYRVSYVAAVAIALLGAWTLLWASRVTSRRPAQST